jgi:hypothetical protein
MCHFYISALLIYKEQEHKSSETNGEAKMYNTLFENSEDAPNIVGHVCLYIRPSTCTT